MSKTGIKSLANDSLIYGLSGVLHKFIAIFLTPLYTRVYNPSDYGIMGLLNNSYSLVSIILILSLDNSTARWFYDTNKTDERQKIISTWIWSYLFLAILFMLLGISAADLLQEKYFPQLSDVSTYIKLLSVSLPFSIWMSVANNVLRLDRKVLPTVSLTLIYSLLLIALNVLFVLILKMGLMGAYYAQLVTNFISMPLSIFLIRGWIKPPKIFSYALWKEMFVYSLPFIPATLAYWVVNLSGVYFVDRFMNETEAGLYQIGVSVASFGALITGAFQQAWGPFAFSVMYTEKAKETFARVLHLYVIFAGLISMGISVFTPEVLLILTTPKYYQAASVASILSFSYFFIGLTYIADIGSAIAKKTAPLGFITTVSSGMVLLFNFIFVPAYGKEGAAFAVCLAQLIPPIYMFYRSQKLYYIPYNFTKVIMTGAIIILFAITGRVISDEFLWSVFLIKVLLCIVLMGVFYFINRRVIHTFVKTTILRS